MTYKLTLTDEASLIARGSIIYHGRARIRVKQGQFVMDGPSGSHALKIDATDLERLNAHWRVFASHPANTYA
jgi:hypothetical protein